jgi:hypothetical protein
MNTIDNVNQTTSRLLREAAFGSSGHGCFWVYRIATMTLLQKYLKAEKYAQSLDASRHADNDAKKSAWAKANVLWDKIKAAKRSR